MDGFHSNFLRTTIVVRIQFARSQKLVQTGAAGLEQKLGATGTYDEPLAANTLTYVRFHAASHLTLDRCERCNANGRGRQDFQISQGEKTGNLPPLRVAFACYSRAYLSPARFVLRRLC
jgi:hypothetical protein